MNKKVESDIRKSKLVLIISSIVIILLVILLIVSKNFGNFSMVRLKNNDNTIFSISDLKVNDLKYGSLEKDIINKFGKPNKEKTYIKDIYSYKNLYYNGITFTVKENYSNYILVKVEITSSKYKISRKINVGDSITSVINSFKVENKTGVYIYGNYSTNALDEEEITDNIYFGLRNSNTVIYINRDAVVSDAPSNIARLDITYKRGKVTKIIWSYDFE